jgi:hypothetical protein
LPAEVTVPLPTDIGSGPPEASARLRVAPNPFNPSTLVSFRIDQEGPVDVSVYDVRGRLVSVLVRGVLPAGEHRVPLARRHSGPRLASGVYYVRLRADGREATVPAVLVQ